MIFPNHATLWIRPSVHEIASRIRSIMTLIFTADLMKLLQQYKLGCKIQILNQRSVLAVFYAYDPLINFH